MLDYFIYTLDYNGKAFYVGKTLYPERRIKKHRSESKLKRTHKEKYINKILLNGGDIDISVIDTVNRGTEDYWEMYWIEQLNNWGIYLCNGTSGGEGGDYWSGKSHKNSTKEKLSKHRYKQIERDGVCRMFGESNGRSKLIDSNVIEMRRLRVEGYSYGKLSTKFGVARSTVIGIIKRRRWKHI